MLFLDCPQSITNMHLFWVKMEPVTWKGSVTYNKCKSFLCFASGQKVVNDPAKMGVSLVHDFINSSYNEEEHKNIFIVVSESRNAKGGKCIKKELTN